MQNPAAQLADGAPLLIVAAKRGRFHVTPEDGALLLRPAADAQQPPQYFIVEELPAYLDSTDDEEPAKSPPIATTTLIGAAAVVAESRPPAKPAAPPPPKPSGPPAPIFGEIPAARTTAAEAASPPADSSPRINRRLLLGAVIALVLTAAVSAWILFTPPSLSSPASARLPSDFDPVGLPKLTTLQKRYVGIYATSGESGERLLELRSDGTYRYQEFGSGVARTANRTGTYTFAFHHDTDSLVIRASVLGTIEVADEQHLLCQRAIFTRLP